LESYECSSPPCIHVVVDYPARRLAAFIETAEGEIIHVPIERLLAACRTASELLSSRFREARGEEVDELAEKYLGATPVEAE